MEFASLTFAFSILQISQQKISIRALPLEFSTKRILNILSMLVQNMVKMFRSIVLSHRFKF